MPIEVTMPRLSDTMEVGTVVKWNVKPGQTVKTGDVLADIETDKATMELQSFDDGTVAKLAIPEGQSVKVGQVILVLAAAGESVDAAATAGGASAAPAAKKAEGASTPPRPAPAHSATALAEPPRSPAPSNGASSLVEPRSGGARIFASPLAKKIAEESGIDLARVEGTGPSGRIIRKDVEAVVNASTPAGLIPSTPMKPAAKAAVAGMTAAHVPPTPAVMIPPPGVMLAARRVTLSSMRRTIAKRLVESKTSIPHYQVTVEAEMDALLALRKQLNDQLESQGVKLSVNDFLVRACALAMHQHPFVNSRWADNNGEAAIDIVGDVNIGVAIALPEDRGGGLVVATLRNADRLGLRLISSQTKALAEKARTKGLTIEEMADSTFTISNLGMFGVDHFTAIINPPNAAILAVGAAIQKPIVKNGELTVGTLMSMTMSSDHRIVDGAMAARYLATVKEMLEKPATLLV